eukprot:1087243-Alexandrium_andersonii.AAC.1
MGLQSCGLPRRAVGEAHGVGVCWCYVERPSPTVVPGWRTSENSHSGRHRSKPARLNSFRRSPGLSPTGFRGSHAATESLEGLYWALE